MDLSISVYLKQGYKKKLEDKVISLSSGVCCSPKEWLSKNNMWIFQISIYVYI